MQGAKKLGKVWIQIHLNVEEKRKMMDNRKVALCREISIPSKVINQTRILSAIDENRAAYGMAI